MLSITVVCWVDYIFGQDQSSSMTQSVLISPWTMFKDVCQFVPEFFTDSFMYKVLFISALFEDMIYVSSIICPIISFKTNFMQDCSIKCFDLSNLIGESIKMIFCFRRKYGPCSLPQARWKAVNLSGIKSQVTLVPNFQGAFFQLRLVLRCLFKIVFFSSIQIRFNNQYGKFQSFLYNAWPKTGLHFKIFFNKTAKLSHKSGHAFLNHHN